MKKFSPSQFFREYKEANLYEQKLSDFLQQGKVNNLFTKIKKAQSILIFGDYDVDGITSTVIMAEIAKLMGVKKVASYIPSRYDGYGATIDFIKPFAENYDLIILVDNGSHETFLKSLIEDKTGLSNRLFVIDHHPSSSFDYSKINFLINPNQNGNVSTSTGLISTFLFKYAWNLHQKHNNVFVGPQASEIGIDHVDDLGAMSAIADMADLNNTYTRFIIKSGFAKIKNSDKILFASREIKKDIYSALAFDVIPKVNSVGRIATTYDINNFNFYNLFFTTKKSNKEDKKLFKEDYSQLLSFNKMRKKATNQIAQRIIDSSLDETKDIQAFYIENCPIGINGLIAQQVLEKTNIPSIAISKNTFNPTMAYGSGRGQDIKQMLDQIQRTTDVVFSFGGHNEALGVQIPCEEIDRFLHAVNNFNKMNEKENKLDIGRLSYVVCQEAVRTEDFLTFVHEYQKACEGIPFGNKFYLPIHIEQALMLQSYNDTPYAKISINDSIVGLGKKSVIQEIYLTDENENTPLIALPYNERSISIDIKHVSTDLLKGKKVKEKNVSSLSVVKPK